jgi:hypothetical protein
MKWIMKIKIVIENSDWFESEGDNRGEGKKEVNCDDACDEDGSDVVMHVKRC